MKTIYIFIPLLIQFFSSAVFPMDPVIINEKFSGKFFGERVEYFEDKSKKMGIEDICTLKLGWTKSKIESLNFGFTESAYWLRFSVKNFLSHDAEWYLEIGYPTLDNIELYIPEKKGGYMLKKAGDKHPFRIREINSRTFVFPIKEPPGERIYYMRFETESSLNFPIVMWLPRHFMNNIFNSLPVFWLYYGLMSIFVIYSLLIFIGTRDFLYLVYVLFISSWTLFQLTLNGFSFQYLWPDSIWWANSCLPFFISTTLIGGVLFFKVYIQTRKFFPIIDKISLALIFANSIVSVLSLSAKYKVAIFFGTVMGIVVVVSLFIMSFIAAFKKSRSAVFFLASFSGLLFGVVLFSLKTLGVLPVNLITDWGIQIGSSLMVLILALGLADKMNIMSRELKLLNADLGSKESLAKERAEHLESIVSTVNDISQDLLKVSNEFTEIGRSISTLSNEQAVSTEQMSATFEELTAGNNNIYQSTISQKKEGENTRELVEALLESQKKVEDANRSVIENVATISASTYQSGENLKNMIEKMRVINEGGKSIKDFVSIINDITDKVNLLSLNAAIEAARAGEAGRGFSVVADEIGKLALATSDNSKEISSQISKIIKDILDGMTIVDNTKNSIGIIVDMVGEIDSSIKSVGALLSEQSGSIRAVVKQAEVIDNISSEIELSSKEHSLSMEETLKTVDRLSAMSGEIAEANQRMLFFTSTINEKANKLIGVIKNINQAG